MFTGIISKVALLELVLLLLLGGGGYWYIGHLNQTIDTLHENNAKLQEAVTIQKDTIAAQAAQTEKQNSAIIVLQKNVADAETQRNNLQDVLRKHDLQALARANASTIERKINSATISAFRDIENITAPQDRLPPTPAVAPTKKATP